MSSAYIVVNKTETKPEFTRLIKLVMGEKLHVKNPTSSNPDIMLIDLEEDKRSIGISTVKAGIKFLAEKPFQESNRFLVIYNAERITIDAQNSLLKTLEEPPEQAIILLVTRSAGALLETINSRCRKISFGTANGTNGQTASDNSNFKNIFSMSFGERLELAEELAKEDKNTVIEFLNDTAKWLVSQAKRDPKTNPKELANKLEKIAKRVTDIDSTNVTVRVALEELFINL